MERMINMPLIAPDQFLPIFIISTLVLVFGVGYAALITLSKMGFFSKKWMPLGYLFWALQTFSLYELSVLIDLPVRSDHTAGVINFERLKCVRITKYGTARVIVTCKDIFTIRRNCQPSGLLTYLYSCQCRLPRCADIKHCQFA